MDKNYNHEATEEKIYKMWEEGGYFTPKIDPEKKPFSIILPLPNANDSMHIGHALFTVQDIMCRYHRMLGEPTLWLPGADHAGIETQYVYEKKLAKEGKSRFDFDRNTFYKMIWDYVEENRELNRDQLKKLGYSLDWSRYHYSLEPEIVEKVIEAFKKFHQDGLVYRGSRIVNYCPKCGTAYSDLEVEHEDRDDFLYYLDYGSITIATTRPETIFADVAIAINPKDKNYKKLKGISAEIPLISRKIPVIEDELVDPEFGTGALKITPAHDPVDFEIGQKHKLETISILDRSGRLVNVPEKYQGMKAIPAREQIVNDLKEAGKLVKIEPLKHSVGICYRCKATIEPMILPQWFIKIQPLAKPAIEAVKSGQTKIVPGKRFEKMYLDWMAKIKDWNVSRQIVWGPRLPIFYCLDCNEDLFINFIDKKGEIHSGTYKELKEKYSFEEIEEGLQSLIAPQDPVYELERKSCGKCAGNHILQETDTFDTWFLSGQWPLNTLGYPDSEDFKYFYPTSVMDTLWDILFFWVARMMMLGLYLAKDVPFKVVHIHARVIDKYGQKMSKSKGNVINPIDMVNKYGADAFRLSIVIGVAPASDFVASEDKARGMRNFCNKLWNISRFILMNYEDKNIDAKSVNSAKAIKWSEVLLKENKEIIKDVTKQIETYRFGQASETLYHYTWHTLADKRIEESKEFLTDEADAPIVRMALLETLENTLKILHPFIPLITEEIWSKLPNRERPLIISQWPK